MNPAEKSLQAALTDFGIQFRTTETVAGVLPAMTIPQCLMVVFISDCYEHRCPLDYPKRKSAKIAKSIASFDKERSKEGWLVVRVWQHEVESNPKLVACHIALIYRAMYVALGF